VTAAEHDRQTRIDRLTAAARRRTATAEQHAEKTIRGMLRNGEQITFRGVQRRSGLSLDFLYTNTTIRTRIEHARDAQTTGAPAPQAQPTPDGGEGTVVRVLTAQLQAAKRQYRIDTDELRRQLAAATGEILALRERIRTLEYHLVGNPSGPT
jgi:Family of unknown function (DUF6262)